MNGWGNGVRLRDRRADPAGRVLTRAFDTGHELRVVSRSRTAPSAAPPAEGLPAAAPATGCYEVPRSGWPVPVGPVAGPVPGLGTPARTARPEAYAPTSPPSADRAAHADRPPPRPAVGPDGGGPPKATAAGLSADDLAADIASIVAGPDRRAGASDERRTAAPARPVPPRPDRQAIFDQLAASMSGARSFDLGAVELERRFDEFDRLSDASAVRAPARPAPRARSAGRVPDDPPRATEVLEDLDAIRSSATSEIPLDPGIGGRSVGVDALEPGDIILSTTTHPLSEQIRAVTDAEVSHAAVYVGEGRVVEAIDGGVLLRSLGTALDDDSLAVAYRHRDMTPTKAALMVRFLEDHARRRTPYDRWGLVQVAPGQLARAICNRLDGEARQRCLSAAGSLRVGTNDENAFFCSELVLEALRRAGLSMSTLQPSWSSPGQIVELHHNGLLDYVGHLKG